MNATCPKCGFAYGWDGTTCRHCTSAKPREATPEVPPAPMTGVPFLDRLLTTLIGAITIAILFGVGALLFVGLEVVQQWLATLFSDDEIEGIPIWKELTLGCVALGLLLGALIGWNMTTERRRTRRRAKG